MTAAYSAPISTSSSKEDTLIVHGFAGIGWSEATPADEVGLELNADMCRTRTNAGHATIRCDVARYPTWVFKGRRIDKVDSPHASWPPPRDPPPAETGPHLT